MVTYRLAQSSSSPQGSPMHVALGCLWAELEEKLNNLDWTYSRKDGEDLNNGSLRDDDVQRTNTIEALRLQILQYNEFVLQQAEMRKHPSPLDQDIRSLQLWHSNYQNRAIFMEEQEYLKHTGDLLSVIPKDKTPLRRLLEKSTSFRIHPLWKDQKSSELPLYGTEYVNYISDKKIDRFVTGLIVVVGITMLIAPMWILKYLSRPAAKLGTITVFIVVFLGMLSYASTAKPYEALGATAAYATVLIVFLQLNAPTSQI